MAPEHTDAAYLWDMMTAAKDAVEILGDVTVREFKAEKIRYRAIERSVEIIGEVARRVSPQYQGEHPEIPWRDIAGQRNILAHEYGQIDYDLLYKTVREVLPELIRVLSQLLPSTD